MYKEINKQNLQIILEKINKALSDVGQEIGINIKLGNIGYTPSGFSSKIEAELTSKGEKAKEADQEKNELLSMSIGFDTNIIGRTIAKGKTNYEIVDIKPRSTKFPVIAKAQDGTLYKFPVSLVRILMK